MTMHLFGAVLTPQAVAHNNRGESEGGTVSTLQKVIRNGDLYSTVSSEAIRYAIREGWAEDNERVNRDVRKPPKNAWTDKEFKKPGDFIDNDVLGFMHAKKETLSRRGVLEISRAVSTTPWPGTVSNHFASAGSNPSVTHENPIPYAKEVHDTRYQYTFAMTPESLLKDKMDRTRNTLLAIQNIRRVGGAHALQFFDFAPEAVVLRWTPDPAPRIMFCFEQGEDGGLSLEKLVGRVRGGDVEPDGLAVGTSVSIDGLKELRELGVKVHDGIKKAFADILARVAKTTKD